MSDYAERNPQFRTALTASDSVKFKPRYRLFYSRRESEQDTYFWFLKGQESILIDQESTVNRLRELVLKLETDVARLTTKEHN